MRRWKPSEHQVQCRQARNAGDKAELNSCDDDVSGQRRDGRTDCPKCREQKYKEQYGDKHPDTFSNSRRARTAEPPKTVSKDRIYALETPAATRTRAARVAGAYISPKRNINILGMKIVASTRTGSARRKASWTWRMTNLAPSTMSCVLLARGRMTTANAVRKGFRMPLTATATTYCPICPGDRMKLITAWSAL